MDTFGFYDKNWVGIEIKENNEQITMPALFSDNHINRFMNILMCMIVKWELFLMLMQTRQHMKTVTECTSKIVKT